MAARFEARCQASSRPGPRSRWGVFARDGVYLLLEEPRGDDGRVVAERLARTANRMDLEAEVPEPAAIALARAARAARVGVSTMLARG